MTAYAVARLKPAPLGPALRRYLAAIDATLAPFGGRFVIHGGPRILLEGSWPEELVTIAFPDLAAARAWYASPAYQAILPLRTGSLEGDLVLVEGVGAGHRATDILADGGAG